MSFRRTARDVEHLVVVAAVMAGALGVLAPPAPTGRPVVDAVYRGVAIGAVTYAGAWAPWWVVAAAGVLAAITVADVLLAVVGVAAVVIAVWVGRQRDERPEWLVVSIGVTMNVLARSQLGGFLGASAVVGVLVGLVVFFVGLSYRPRVVRRTAWASIAVLVAVAGVAAAAFGLAAVDVRSDLHNGQQAAEIGVDVLHQGDYVAAVEQFDAAATWLGDSADVLHGPFSSGVALIPVLAQHRAVAADLSAAGADVSRRLVTAVRQGGGRPDCATVEAALATLREAVDDARSPWLVPEVAEELDSMDDHLGPRTDSVAC